MKTLPFIFIRTCALCFLIFAFYTGKGQEITSIDEIGVKAGPYKMEVIEKTGNENSNIISSLATFFMKKENIDIVLEKVVWFEGVPLGMVSSIEKPKNDGVLTEVVLNLNDYSLTFTFLEKPAFISDHFHVKEPISIDFTQDETNNLEYHGVVLFPGEYIIQLRGNNYGVVKTFLLGNNTEM